MKSKKRRRRIFWRSEKCGYLGTLYNNGCHLRGGAKPLDFWLVENHDSGGLYNVCRVV